MSEKSNVGWIVAVSSLVFVCGILIAVVVYLLPAKTPQSVAKNEVRQHANNSPKPSSANKDDRFVEGAIVGGILGSVVTHALDNNNRSSSVVVVERGRGHRD